MESVNGSRKTFKIKGNTPLCITILFLIILWGCAKKDVIKNVPDEEALRNRIVKYWDHKVKEEFDKSYEYEDPLYRKQVSMINYIRSFNIGRAKWLGAEIQKIDIEEDNAMVDMKLKIAVATAGNRAFETEAPIKDKWVKMDVIWYHVVRKQGVQYKEN